MQNLNESLQAKYPHLEISVFNFKKVSTHLIFGSEFNSSTREQALQTLNINSSKTLNDYFDLINITVSSVKESVYVYDLTHSLGNFMCDVELSNDDLGSTKKEAIAGDFVISRLRSYLQEMAVIQPKNFRQLLSTEYLVYRAKTDLLSANTLMVFALTKEIQTILNHSQYGTEHPRFYEFVLNEMPIPNALLALNNYIDLIMKKAYEILETSKVLYKEAQELLYKELELDFKNPLESLLKSSLQANDYSLSLRGSETSAAIQSKNIDCHESRCDSRNDGVVDCHAGKSARNDKTACHNESSPCHTDLPCCHTEPSPCHTDPEQSEGEVSKKSKCGYFANAQYDNMDSSLHKNDNIGCIATKYPHLNISVRPLSKSLHKSGRLDSEYYQSKYDLMENKIKDYKGGYCKLQPSEIKDSNFTPKAQEKYRYIELANIGNNGNISEPLEDFGENLPTRARRKVKTGDFIMSSIEGSLTSCALITPEFDNCLVSTGFYVLNSSELNSETLLVLFKCEFFQEYLKKFPSGTILIAISKDELQNILIPKIATATQEQIALKIQKSFTLRAKSKDLLQNAKIKLENAIENFCDI